MKRFSIFSIVVMILCLFMSMPVSAASSKKICKESGCNNTATSNRGYCSSHTCTYGNCNAHRITDSRYCYSHSDKSTKKSYDAEVKAETEKALAPFKEAKAKEIAKKTCKESGCKNSAVTDRGYCKSHTCTYGNCDARRTSGSTYCYTHTKSKGTSSSNKSTKTSTKSTTKSKTSNDSYDEGYEDYWLDGDYDDDRYRTDWSYALGVDDAMDEFD